MIQAGLVVQCCKSGEWAKYTGSGKKGFKYVFASAYPDENSRSSSTGSEFTSWLTANGSPPKFSNPLALAASDLYSWEVQGAHKNFWQIAK